MNIQYIIQCMRLFIAEKPSLGRALAAALPKPHQSGEGFIRAANGDCVSWCIGHLLELEEPKAYDPAYAKWQLQHLPILPNQWQLKPKTKTKKQLSVLRKLVREADQLVHAGDPDREGQLLVDQVIDYLKVPAAKKQNIQRCLINDLNLEAVQKALQSLRPNSEFIPLSVSALARTRADWLYGINMTRAYTLQGRKVGYQGLLSVGRVQTPLLGMVVRRDLEIEEFVSKPFYEVFAHIEMEKDQGVRFKAKWKPSEACEPYRDEEGRVVSKALAENVVGRITDQPAKVEKVAKKIKTQAPPLPYNLSSLQIDAAKRYGYKAQQVLDICQKLYEREKLITYPRSDCRYLPKEHFSQAPAVVSTVTDNGAFPQEWSNAVDVKRQSKAWNDSKVDAHHAIIPTTKRRSLEKLSREEANVYQLIARQYLAQFCLAHRYEETIVELCIAGGTFIAKARKILELGWKQLFQKSEGGQSKQSKEKDKESGDDDFCESLPELKKGEHLHCKTGELVEKQTKPPKYFTDATLLAAMTGISRFVKDPEIKKILRETDGLGTEATRAGIIELLFQRKFLYRNGKTIRATEAGRGLIKSLPEIATTPDMTARWESSLLDISERKQNYQLFMDPMVDTLSGLIRESKDNMPVSLKGVKSSPTNFRRKRKSSSSSFKKKTSGQGATRKKSTRRAGGTK